jgi:hypothetical protein
LTPLPKESSAKRIANGWIVHGRHWAPDAYVTRLQVESKFIGRYRTHIARSPWHKEYRIKREDLDVFNEHILGPIEIIAAFARGSPRASDSGPIGGFHAAFPDRLAKDVTAVLGIIPAEPRLIRTVGPLTIAGETVCLPYRVSVPEPLTADLQLLTGPQRMIMDCLYTRHHDGYVRERYLRSLLGTPGDPAIAPFVIQLLGEYVEEICAVVADWPSGLAKRHYVRFAAENPAFTRLTCDHAMSYWASDERRRYDFLEMPAYGALTRLGIWDQRIGRRRRRRAGRRGSRPR